jgi:MFS family permease
MKHPLIGLAIVGLGASLAPLDIAVNVGAAGDHRAFPAGAGDVQWLVICYVLVYGSLMLVCGKLGDLFGYRLIFRIGSASRAGCVACAMAPTGAVPVARASQGVGTALALSCTPRSPPRSTRPSSATGARGLFHGRCSWPAPRSGPVAGRCRGRAVGLACRSTGCACRSRWLALALSGLLPSPQAWPPRPFDAPGALLVAGCMSAFLLALVLSQRPTVPGWQALAVLIVALELLRRYVGRSRHLAEPIIRPALFADAAFTVPNVMYVVASLAGFSILLLTPYYLVNVLKLSALESGGVLALSFAGGLTGAPLSALLVRAVGRRMTAFLGIFVVGAGLLPLAFTDAATPVAVVALLLIAEGVGQGLLSVAYLDLVTATLPERDRGVAGSLAQLTGRWASSAARRC